MSKTKERNYFKKALSIFLTLILILSISVPLQVEATNVGDKKYTYQVYTLNEVNNLCNKFYKLKNKVANTKVIADIICTVLPDPNAKKIIKSIYNGTTKIITYDLSKEYKFYKNIKDTMIKKNYKKVKIKYTSEYVVYKYYWEKFYSWKVTNKSVNKYYK